MKSKPYICDALAGLTLVVSVVVNDQFFGTSTTFPRVSTLVVDTIGIDLSNTLFYQTSDGELTGAALPNWQLMFVIGIGVGAFLMSRINRTFKRERLPEMWVSRFGPNMGKRVWSSLAGGILVIVGARMAGGCPSGHGVSGVSQLGLSSLVALIMFFGGGITVAHILYPRNARKGTEI